jgi:single-strand DNA-binding protein
MFNDLNYCAFTGRLGKDAELRYTASGVPVVSFKLAVGGSRKTDDGWESTVTWINVVKWFRSDADEQASKFARRLKKGSRVTVEGRLQNRKWEDKHGQTRYSTDIVSRAVHFIEVADIEEEEESEEVPF